MYLKKTPNKKGRISLSAVQGYRDPKTKKTRQYTVESFGYVDELEKQYKDPIAHFKGVVAEMDKKRLEKEGPQTLTIYPKQKINLKSINRKAYGDAIICAYLDALEIEETVRSLMRTSKANFDLNALLRLLVSERIIDPGSKRGAWQNADRHFFRANLSEADVYRGLDEIARISDSIVTKMNTTIEKTGIRDLSTGYYDCTNYYFECEEDDFRKKGVSKEHRPNPIVQMGLMQDANAIPVNFKLFEGNVHDSQTLIDALPEIKSAAGMKRVVTVADKGMNTSENIIATFARGDGFVFSQSIRGTKSSRSLRKWVLDDTGYKINEQATFKVKSRQDYKSVTVDKDLSFDAKSHKVDIPVKIVAFWSKKYEVRARKEREKVLRKAQQIVDHPSKYKKVTHLGAAKYVKGINYDKESAEIIDCGTVPEIDKGAIAADEACDGYYLIITSETSWSDEKIIDTYRQLWKIEETFKVTKSVLKTRPVHVWKKEHIKAHFLTCYIALSIIRIIEFALGNDYCANQIVKDIRKQKCSNAADGWWLLDYRTSLTDKLYELIGEDTPKKWMSPKNMKELFHKGKKVCWKPKYTT